MQTNPNVPPRPALDYGAMGTTQPTIQHVYTPIPQKFLRSSLSAAVEVPSVISHVSILYEYCREAISMLI